MINNNDKPEPLLEKFHVKCFHGHFVKFSTSNSTTANSLWSANIIDFWNDPQLSNYSTVASLTFLSRFTFGQSRLTLKTKLRFTWTIPDGRIMPITFWWWKYGHYLFISLLLLCQMWHFLLMVSDYCSTLGHSPACGKTPSCWRLFWALRGMKFRET